MPSHDEMKDIGRRIQLLAGCYPGTSFRLGVSSDMLSEHDPFAELSGLTQEESLAILQEAWDSRYSVLGESVSAVEAFIFGCVFGHDTVAWLLSEAVRLGCVDRSYVMKEPPGSTPLTIHLAAEFLKGGDVTRDSFRMLNAGYVGWLNSERVQEQRRVRQQTAS